MAKVVFGYLRWLAAGGPSGAGGNHVIPGVEVDHLAGSGGAPRHPITVGLYDYRIAGKKGDLINFLIGKGTQMVSVDSRNPDYAGRHLNILLENKEKSVNETVNGAMYGVVRRTLVGGAADIAGAAMGAGASGLITEGNAMYLNARNARTVGNAAMGAVSGGGGAAAAGGAQRIPHLAASESRYDRLSAFLSDFKVITITTDFAASRRGTASRVAETGARNLNFSAIAAWAFGS